MMSFRRVPLPLAPRGMEMTSEMCLLAMGARVRSGVVGRMC
jgi:hypothetical protein